MAFFTDVAGFISTKNSGELKLPSYSYANGDVQGSTKTTLVLENSASASDDAYNNFIVMIPSGNANGYIREILDYDGASRTLTVVEWDVIPNTAATYTILPNSGRCQQSVGSNGIVLGPHASSIDNFYNGSFIYMRVEYGHPSQIRAIAAYNGTTRVATMEAKWADNPNKNSLYCIVGESGLATGGSTTTIDLDGNQSALIVSGLMIEIHSGTGVGQARIIDTLVTNTATMTIPWTIAPDSTSTYSIFSGWVGEFEETDTIAQHSVLVDTKVRTGDSSILVNQFKQLEVQAAVRSKPNEISWRLNSPAHTLTTIGKYFRSKMVALGVGVSGYIQVKHHKYQSNGLVTKVSEQISGANDARIVLSVIKGRQLNGIYRDVGVTSLGGLKCSLEEPLSAFGDVKIVECRPRDSTTFSKGLNPLIVSTYDTHLPSISVMVEGTAGVAQVQDLCLFAASNFTSSGAADYFLLYSPTTTYYVWFDVDDGCTDPSPGGTGIEVDILSADSASAVATNTATDIGLNVNFAATTTGSIVHITNAAVGVAESVSILGMPVVLAGSQTVDDSMLTVSVNPVSLITSRAQTRHPTLYQPGTGLIGKFTAMFSEPKAGTEMTAGLGNQYGGFKFGYNGLNFGIVHKHEGRSTIKRLTITTSANGSETVTLVLNGTTIRVAVTNVSIEENARQISSIDFTQSGYTTDYVSNEVIFTSIVLENQTNTFSVAATGTLVAAWSTLKAGRLEADEWIYQRDWRHAKLNGFGSTTMYIKPQNLNVYQIAYQWLGAGNIFFYVETSIKGKFQLVHDIKFAGRFQKPSIEIPDVHMQWEAKTTTGAESVSVSSSCGMVGYEGRITDRPLAFSLSTSISMTSDGANYMMSVKNNATFAGKPNTVTLYTHGINMSSVTNRPARVEVFKEMNLTDVKFTHQRENASTASVDTSTFSSFTGGVNVATLTAPRNGSITDDRVIAIEPGTTLSFTVERLDSNTTDVDITVNWLEYH